jgi:hypothetical protein
MVPAKKSRDYIMSAYDHNVHTLQSKYMQFKYMTVDSDLLASLVNFVQQ